MKTNVTIIYKIGIILLTLILFFIDANEITYRFISLVTWFDLIICTLYLYKNNSVNINNPVFLFWIITIIFSFGQNIIFPFIIDIYSVKKTLLYSFVFQDYDLCKGTIFTLQAFNLFTLGLFSEKNFNFKIRNKQTRKHFDD